MSAPSGYYWWGFYPRECWDDVMRLGGTAWLGLRTKGLCTSEWRLLHRRNVRTVVTGEYMRTVVRRLVDLPSAVSFREVP